MGDPTEVVFDEEQITISNRQRVGFVGEKNACAIYILDGQNPCAIIDSESDVFVRAKNYHQVESKTRNHSVTEECTEIYKKMNHTVNTNKTSEIGANYSLEVGGTHDIVAKGKQTIQAKAGQETMLHQDRLLMF